MAPVLRQGWEVNDPAASSTKFKAKIPVTAVSGSSAGRSTQIAVVNNISTGSFDLYTPTTFGFGDPFASYSPSQDKLIPKDKGTFDLFFDQNTPTGKSQLTNITKSTKLATYDLAQLQTGTDPTSNKDFENIKKLKGYQSLANSTPPGQRAPGAVPTDPENPSGGDPQAPKTSVEELTSGIKDNAEKIRQQYGNWRYPITMNSTQDRIKFTMYRYAKKPFQASGVLTGEAFGQRTLGASMGSVVLPIQPTISDSNRVQWGETPMTALEQAPAGLSLSVMAGGSEGANKAVSGVGQEDMSAAATALVAGLAGKAGGVTGGGLLTRLTGGVLNNNLELLFQGPSLRTFSFTFSMSARDEKEAKTVRNIIRFFKQGMSVKRSTSNLFIMSPNIFTVKYYYGGESTEHPWINKIKECALTDCSVNYTPAGNYATYEDGAMTQYDVTLNFSELDFIYDDMYGNGSGTSDETEIGY